MANAKYFLKRFAMALLTIFLVACLTFLLMNAVPGSPWLSEKTPSAATLAALNAKYGLDKPVHVQLFMYLKNILHGDFGVSLKMQKNRAVLDIIVEMFPVSAKVGALALLWAIIVGVPLGCLAAFKRGKLTDSILRVICTLGISMPSFVVASVLLVTLTGDGALNLFPSIFDASQGIRAYILPCFALGFYPMCYTARQTRSAMLDSLSQEYIKTARAKGLKNKKIIFKHALRNALIPVITYVGPMTASILTAFLTSKITRDNEMRKIIHQKRLELYLEVFEQVELLLKDWKKIFDKEYFEKIASYKSRMKLLASEKTTEEYKKYYEVLRTSVNEYKKFKDDNDPDRAEDMYEEDEDGTIYQIYYPTDEDYSEYRYKIDCYEKEQKKRMPLMREYIQKIVDAMRTDLGSNLDKESAIYDFVQRCRKHE